METYYTKWPKIQTVEYFLLYFMSEFLGSHKFIIHTVYTSFSSVRIRYKSLIGIKFNLNLKQQYNAFTGIVYKTVVMNVLSK